MKYYIQVTLKELRKCIIRLPTALELKFTSLKPAFQLSQHLYQAAAERQEGEPQPFLGEQLLGRRKKYPCPWHAKGNPDYLITP